MSDDIIQKLRDAPRRPDCKHGNRPKSCLECEIEELEAEATASMTEITRLRAEIERLREALKHIAAIYHVRIDDVRGNLWEHQRIALAALKEIDE